MIGSVASWLEPAVVIDEVYTPGIGDPQRFPQEGAIVWAIRERFEQEELFGCRDPELLAKDVDTTAAVQELFTEGTHCIEDIHKDPVG